MHVIVLVAIDGDVGGSGIEGRCVNLAEATPFRQVFWGDIGPALATITSELDEAIIGAGPDQALGEGRLGQGKDRVVVFRAGVVDGDRSARGLLLAFVVAREVGADRLPV